jgi:hypothetical protein
LKERIEKLKTLTAIFQTVVEGDVPSPQQPKASA